MVLDGVKEVLDRRDLNIQEEEEEEENEFKLELKGGVCKGKLCY